MWQRQRTPHRSLLLQSLEKLGVMHHSPTLSPLSLSISPIVSPFIHLSAPLLSVLMHCLTFTQELPLHNTSASYLSPFFLHNSLKGGISKSTNGGDLIGKCYKGGGAVYCQLWWLESKGLTLQKDWQRKCRCLPWRWVDAADKLHIIRWSRGGGKGHRVWIVFPPSTVTKLLLDTIINVIIFGVLYYLSFSLG